MTTARDHDVHRDAMDMGIVSIPIHADASELRVVARQSKITGVVLCRFFGMRKPWSCVQMRAYMGWRSL